MTHFEGIARAIRRGRVPTGWVEIGSGHFSKVWANAAYPDIVLKLSGDGGYGDSDSTSRTGNKDYGHIKDAFPQYVAWCKANSHLRGLPVIYEHGAISKTMFYTVIERLHSYHEAPDSWKPAFIRHYESYNEQALKRRARHGEAYALTMCKIHHWVNKSEGNLSTDMHTGNFMFRTDGTLVITDPVCGER